MTCTCVYATSENTESVRKGFEVGGYLKEECPECKAESERWRAIDDADEVKAAAGLDDFDKIVLRDFVADGGGHRCVFLVHGCTWDVQCSCCGVRQRR